MIEASLITTCKGRRKHLEETLSSMTAQVGVKYELIIVDYDDPEFSWELAVNGTKFQNRCAVRVIDGAAGFNINRARNYGAKWAQAPVLAFVDADVILSAGWLRIVVDTISSGCNVVSRGQSVRGITGTFAVSRTAYDAVNGFDESLEGWGYDEVDFFKRCDHRVGVRATYDPGLVRALEHDDDLRTMYYEEKDILVSNVRNSRRAKDPAREVNAGGYAVGRALYYRFPDSPHVA